MVEVREITFSELIFESSLTRVSCIPETKYSCSGLPERLSNGRTAIESISESLLNAGYSKTIDNVRRAAIMANAGQNSFLSFNIEKNEMLPLLVLLLICAGEGITSPSFAAA